MRVWFKNGLVVMHASVLFKVCLVAVCAFHTRVYLLTLSDSCCWKTFIVLLSWKLTEVGEKSSDSLLQCKRVSCWFFWHERQTASTSTAFQEQTAGNCTAASKFKLRSFSFLFESDLEGRPQTPLISDTFHKICNVTQTVYLLLTVRGFWTSGYIS